MSGTSAGDATETTSELLGDREQPRVGRFPSSPRARRVFGRNRCEGSWPAESATPVSTAISSAASGLSATPTRYGFVSRVGRWTGGAT
jgi:hypothetical protein